MFTNKFLDMKKQVLYLSIILMAAFTPLILEITLHNWWVFLSLIPAIPVIWWAQGKLLHAATDYVLEGVGEGIRKGMDDFFKSEKFVQSVDDAMDCAWKEVFGGLKAPAPKVVEPTIADRQSVEKPELVATREWVDEIFSTKMANAMFVDGRTHRHINRRLDRLERLSRQGGWLAFTYPRAVSEGGFDYLCGTLTQGENGPNWCLVDVVVHNGYLVSGTVVDREDARYKANAEAAWDIGCNTPIGEDGQRMNEEVYIEKHVAESLVASVVKPV